MDHNWGYVAVGYVGTLAVLGTYCAVLISKLRKAPTEKHEQR